MECKVDLNGLSREYKALHHTDKVVTLAWSLMGKAAAAEPETFEALFEVHMSGDAQPERKLADLVQAVAKRFPESAFTHM